MSILFHQTQGGDDQGVIEFLEGPAFEKLLGDLGRFLGIHPEQALIKPGFYGQNFRVA